MIRDFNAKVRQIDAAVYYKDEIWKSTDRLISISVERPSGNTFFGYGITQHGVVNIIGDADATSDSSFRIKFNDTDCLPTFFVSSTRHDEIDGHFTLYGYDWVYSASKYTYADLNMKTPYTVAELLAAIVDLVAYNQKYICKGFDKSLLDLSYDDGASYEDTTTLREILDDIAEITQSIYFVNSDDDLVLKRLTTDDAVEITKDLIYDLDREESRRLKSICSTTTLGDNVIASADYTGSTAYIRNNGLWETRDDITTLVQNALTAVGGFTITQYSMTWRGNPFIELGTCFIVTAKDDTTFTTYLLDDSIDYTGSYQEVASFVYEDDQYEEATDVSDVLNETRATVDKANQRIELVVKSAQEVLEDNETIKTRMTQIEQTSTEITAGITTIYDSVNTLTEQTELKLDDSSFSVKFAEELAATDIAATSIITSTNYTFTDAGLNISKSDSTISTRIDEEGLHVSASGEEALTADYNGVNARNLHATTYLYIGKNSRFEDCDYGTRTGCFWVGG